jgi:hypothetical protein
MDVHQKEDVTGPMIGCHQALIVIKVEKCKF